MFLDVMGPDEWHFPVVNSAYTNLIARDAMELPAIIRNMLPGGGAPLPTMTPEIYIPFDEKLMYHPEFEGYSLHGKFYETESFVDGKLTCPLI